MQHSSTALKSADNESTGTLADRVRLILRAHGRLGRDSAQLSDDDDLYAFGMTSLASVNVMLALEAAFDIEFPDRMLKRSVFETVAAIRDAVAELKPK